MLDYSINLFIVLIKYYIYTCRFSGQKPCVSDVIDILKRTYETEIQSVSFYQTPAIREMNCEEMGRYLDNIGIKEVTQHIYCSRKYLNKCTTHMDSEKVHPKCLLLYCIVLYCIVYYE